MKVEINEEICVDQEVERRMSAVDLSKCILGTSLAPYMRKTHRNGKHLIGNHNLAYDGFEIKCIDQRR